MTTVQNTRNKKLYELLSISETGVKLKELETSKEKMITNEVYNRWYKTVEEEQSSEEVEGADELEPTENDVEPTKEELEPEQEEVKEEPAVEPEAPVEEPKPKKKAGRPKKAKAPKEPKSKEPHILKDVLEKILKAVDGLEIFVTKVKGFHTVKIGGKMCMAYTYSTKGIVLWMRSKAIETLPIFEQTKYMKHMFDRRLSLTENTEEVVDLMREIVNVSVEYQKGINEARQAKIAAREQYLKEKEAKREAKKQKDMEAKFNIKQKKNKKQETEENEEQGE